MGPSSSKCTWFLTAQQQSLLTQKKNIEKYILNATLDTILLLIKESSK